MWTEAVVACFQSSLITFFWKVQGKPWRLQLGQCMNQGVLKPSISRLYVRRSATLPNLLFSIGLSWCFPSVALVQFVVGPRIGREPVKISLRRLIIWYGCRKDTPNLQERLQKLMFLAVAIALSRHALMSTQERISFWPSSHYFQIEILCRPLGFL
jgi:hypothetical protein